jgi:thioredoxin-like negative regulator of GroEL
MKQLWYFTADWCAPCKALGPTMDRVAEQIQVNKINIDYEADVIKKYGVRNIPTVILVENGQEARRFSGNKSYNDVLNFINNG